MLVVLALVEVVVVVHIDVVALGVLVVVVMVVRGIVQDFNIILNFREIVEPCLKAG